MKIITTTIFRSLNFGAVLQAYALHHKLGLMGYNCQILNYRPDEVEQKFKSFISKPKNFKQVLYNLILILRYKRIKKMYALSNSFLDNYLNLTNRYSSYQELLNNPPSADVFISGSDQIWNPHLSINNGLSPIYFLNFISDTNVIKASFAASIGESFLENQYKVPIKEYLKSFDYISVREENAKELLSFVDKRIDVVSDPVFLLKKEEWLRISKTQERKDKYILCYFIYQPKFLNAFLKKIKKLTGYTIISVSNEPFSKVFNDVFINEIGPQEFLGYIANAEYIITSSFHGTALSLILQKNFYTVVSPNRGSRIYNVLQKTCLFDRIISDDLCPFDLSPIDYIEVGPKVSKLRNESLAFLDIVLKSKK